MPIDPEFLRAERIRVHEANKAGDWNERERLLIERDRAELAEQRAAAEHEAELSQYAAFAERRAAAASDRGDQRAEMVWGQAMTNIGYGTWIHERLINSDPEITRFQALRSRLALAGKAIE